MSAEYTLLLHFSNLSYSTQSIQDRHLVIEEDDGYLGRMWVVAPRECGREQEVEGFLAVIRDGDFVVELLELLLEDSLLQNALACGILE